MQLIKSRRGRPSSKNISVQFKSSNNQQPQKKRKGPGRPPKISNFDAMTEDDVGKRKQKTKSKQKKNISPQFKIEAVPQQSYRMQHIEKDETGIPNLQQNYFGHIVRQNASNFLDEVSDHFQNNHQSMRMSNANGMGHFTFENSYNNHHHDYQQISLLHEQSNRHFSQSIELLHQDQLNKSSYYKESQIFRALNLQGNRSSSPQQVRYINQNANQTARFVNNNRNINSAMVKQQQYADSQSFSDMRGSRKDKNGLKQLSRVVYNIVKEFHQKNQRKNYLQIASELNRRVMNKSQQLNQSMKDYKRRVYDALNVMVAAKILKKQGRFVYIARRKGATGGLQDKQQNTRLVKFAQNQELSYYVEEAVRRNEVLKKDLKFVKRLRLIKDRLEKQVKELEKNKGENPQDTDLFGQPPGPELIMLAPVDNIVRIQSNAKAWQLSFKKQGPPPKFYSELEINTGVVKTRPHIGTENQEFIIQDSQSSLLRNAQQKMEKGTFQANDDNRSNQF